jgi:hypothetical protein
MIIIYPSSDTKQKLKIRKKKKQRETVNEYCERGKCKVYSKTLIRQITYCKHDIQHNTNKLHDDDELMMIYLSK